MRGRQKILRYEMEEVGVREGWIKEETQRRGGEEEEGCERRGETQTSQKERCNDVFEYRDAE